MRKLLFTLLILFAFSCVGFCTGNDAYTVFLPHFNGNDGDISTTDSAIGGNAPHTITRGGSVVIDDAQYKWTTSSLFDGVGDYWSMADSADWDFGTGNFTIDFWVMFNSSIPSNWVMLVGQWFFSDPTFTGWRIAKGYGGDSDEIVFQEAAGGIHTTVDAGIVADTWYHIAIVRKGTGANECAIYINGVSKVTFTQAGNINGDDNYTFRIGKSVYDDLYLDDFSGWMDEVRISKGIARWTENFDVPTEEYSEEPEAEHPTTSQLLLGGMWFKDGKLQYSDWTRFKRGTSE